MVLVSYGTGAPAATTEILRQLGSTQIKVSPRWGWMGGRSGGREIRIRYDDLDAIRDACPSVGQMAAGYRPGMGGPAYSADRSWPWAGMDGVGHEYQEVSDLKIIAGRWFTEEEEFDRAKVAVLNLPLAKGLFKNQDPIGQWIDCRSRRFEVIGVLWDPKSFQYGMFVPYTAALGLGEKSGKEIDWLAVKPVREDLGADAIGELRKAFGSIYAFDPDDQTALRIEEQTGFIAQVNAVSTGLEGLVITIALVALVLGCLGAANVVGITVAERSGEIGLRKALGATPLRIKAEVLAESLLLCVAGGGLGVLLGMAAVSVLGPLHLSASVEITPRADLQIFGVGLAVLVFVGTVAGLPAAKKAAGLDPVVTLREG